MDGMGNSLGSGAITYGTLRFKERFSCGESFATVSWIDLHGDMSLDALKVSGWSIRSGS